MDTKIMILELNLSFPSFGGHWDPKCKNNDNKNKILVSFFGLMVVAPPAHGG